MTPKERNGRLVPKYREPIRTTERVTENAGEILKKTERVHSIDMMTEIAIKEVRRQIDHYCGLAGHVEDQARRRVINNKQVLNNLMVMARPLIEKQEHRRPRAA